MRSIAVAAAAVLLAGCGGPSAPDTAVGIGVWGGVGIRLDLTAQGAAIEYDCAHGTIDQPLVADRNGRFSATGVHVREHGGPIRPDEPSDRHPARYDGEVTGTSMRMTVMLLDLAQSVGPFDLTLGGAARIAKCV